ncbi:uncharacterized protein [Arachis hypogaea]|uniref:uncharacterized protein isoform X1 n=1 Tax=Arachis hypogaea TaxID=3818 RepID=UPI000DEC6B36|nr:uncharacterized protein LOC112728821 [Arachis hypogaea]XP_025662919.1 uncharacterized protein LOC112758451 [Arachis hypogaea]
MAMACGSCSSLRHTMFLSGFNSQLPLSSSSPSSLIHFSNSNRSCMLLINRQIHHLTPEVPVLVARASPGNDGATSPDDDDDGVSLGTMKLPSNTDLQRFDSLLFQWANSLCQGANLPLPVPLKVDKIAGGARLGFITIDDGKPEVLVHIDCVVFPATENSVPIFRATRNGPMKDNAPPGEPRIMRSLLQALQKSVEIARL